jgi:transposase InsO family protein
LVSADFFVVPTIAFQLMFAFVILSHDRRRPLHFAVTANPTAEWTARQLLEAFPWDNASQYLLRDRDSIYGEKFCETARWMGIREVLTAPQSPWQNGHVERFIGSIRRECLDHVIIFHKAGLRRILKNYFEYYEKCRTHLSLEKDACVTSICLGFRDGRRFRCFDCSNANRVARQSAHHFHVLGREPRCLSLRL